MSYTALYRRFRPQVFADVRGQEHIVTTLRNQIRADRIGHAYLFCGTRGTGKTTIAKLFARAVNCQNPDDGSPCGMCPSCLAIQEGNSMNVIEIDAASNNGVDNIRQIREEVAYSPTEGRFKVYIIDEVHMLSIGAFNALLKTLEEPPSYVIFILATTEVHKLPITILSRCQRYDFRRITIDTIAARLNELLRAEEVTAEERAVRYIAKAGDGSMRDAISLLDLCIAFYLGQELTYDKVLMVLGAADNQVFGRMLSLIAQKDAAGLIAGLEELLMQGREPGQLVTDLIWYLRSLLLLQSSDDMEEVLDLSSENLAEMKEEAAKIESEELMRCIRIFSELSNQLRYASQKRILIEIALIKLCRPQMEENLESLLARMDELERRLQQGMVQTLPGTAGMAFGGDGGNRMPGVGPAGDPAMQTSQMAAFAGQQPGSDAQTALGTAGRAVLEVIPQDVQEAVKRWRSIVGNLPGSLRTFLRDARLSLGPENTLLIVFEDEFAENYVNTEAHKQEIADAVAASVGKAIEIRIQRNESQHSFEDSYVDIEKVIHMELEIEED